MATIVDIGFRQDGTVFVQADWDEFNFFFFDDVAETQPTNFNASTFEGEVLDKEGGVKLFDLTFNTPDTTGQIWPQLDDADTTTLTGRTVWYWVKVITGSSTDAYFFGELTVSGSFVAGSV